MKLAALSGLVPIFEEVGTNGLPLEGDARPSFVLGGPSVKLHCDAASNTIQPARDFAVSAGFSV